MMSHTLEKMILFCSDTFLSELTWQVLIEGYLTSLLFVHQLTFGLRCVSVNQYSKLHENIQSQSYKQYQVSLIRKASP